MRFPADSIVVGILDGDSWTDRTDVLIVVLPVQKKLLWIPRDLYAPALGDRINAAVRFGGPALLRLCLRQLGVPVKAVGLIQRRACARLLQSVCIEVPVARALRLRYPLRFGQPIEAGAKDIGFDPPTAWLSGERVHQWIGARYGDPEGDLGRCARQQVFVRTLLESQADFSPMFRQLPLEAYLLPAICLEALMAVRADWSFETLQPLRHRFLGSSPLLEHQMPVPRSFAENLCYRSWAKLLRGFHGLALWWKWRSGAAGRAAIISPDTSSSACAEGGPK